MTDEKYLFLSDVKDKKRTAHGAFNKVRGTGRRVNFPSDYLTEREKKSMNSEVKSFDLKQPMKWAEFCAMPEELQREYIIRLRNLYSVSIDKLSQMFGVHYTTVHNKLHALKIEKLPPGVRCSPEFDSFVKYGTPREATPLGDLISPELKAKLDEYEEKHPPAVIAKVEPPVPIDVPIGASCGENIPHNRLSAKDYGSLNYVSGCLSALRAIYATETNCSFYDGALAAIGQIIDSVEVYT